MEPQTTRLFCKFCQKPEVDLWSKEVPQCLACGKAAFTNSGVILENSTLKPHESWQSIIYDSRKSQYFEQLPDKSGIQSLLLTYRETMHNLDRLGIASTSRVLDIGCNNGKFLNLLAKRYAVQQGVGMDISIEALLAANENNPYQHRYLHGNAQNALPFANESFHYVFCFDVLEHIENPLETAREIFRVLAPGGKALFHFPVSDFMFSVDWICQKVNYKKWKQGCDQAGHDYRVILTRAGYESLFRSAGFQPLYSYRYNVLLQNIFDYHLTHRILNRMFYVWSWPFHFWHNWAAPLIELAVSPDRLLARLGIGASVYVAVQKPINAL
jgi:SAM-dependent methyltransferase